MGIAFLVACRCNSCSFFYNVCTFAFGEINILLLLLPKSAEPERCVRSRCSRLRHRTVERNLEKFVVGSRCKGNHNDNVIIITSISMIVTMLSRTSWTARAGIEHKEPDGLQPNTTTSYKTCVDWIGMSELPTDGAKLVRNSMEPKQQATA